MSADTKATACALQDTYLQAVAEARRIEREAQKRAVKTVNAAEAARNAALEAAGISWDEFRDALLERDVAAGTRRPDGSIILGAKKVSN